MNNGKNYEPYLQSYGHLISETVEYFNGDEEEEDEKERRPNDEALVLEN